MSKVKSKQMRFDPACQVHGANLLEKERDGGKYKDKRGYLKDIREKYDVWVQENTKIVGPKEEKQPTDQSTVVERVKSLLKYKDFLDQQKYAEAFDSRSNLHSTVLEEFVYYLFADAVATFDGQPLIGKSHTFKDLFFFPESFSEMVKKPHAKIEKKDHDFVIGARVSGDLRCRGSELRESFDLDVPAVAIECKTYLDKTMLEGSSTAAEQLKARNPNAIYIVVMEWLKLSEDVNIRKFKVDQIYVLRQQQNTDQDKRFLPGYVKNQIRSEVVWHLFETVRKHLTAPWGGGVKDGMKRGWLL